MKKTLLVLFAFLAAQHASAVFVTPIDNSTNLDVLFAMYQDECSGLAWDGATMEIDRPIKPKKIGVTGGDLGDVLDKYQDKNSSAWTDFTMQLFPQRIRAIHFDAGYYGSGNIIVEKISVLHGDERGWEEVTITDDMRVLSDKTPAQDSLLVCFAPDDVPVAIKASFTSEDVTGERPTMNMALINMKP